MSRVTDQATAGTARQTAAGGHVRYIPGILRNDEPGRRLMPFPCSSTHADNLSCNWSLFHGFVSFLESMDAISLSYKLLILNKVLEGISSAASPNFQVRTAPFCQT